ncbi:MAG TPA: hypothetical protein VF297_04580 [Pyrinomonadaceae bacterium]
MNEEPTKDLGQKYDTKPALETILERMVQMEVRLSKEFNNRFDNLENRFNGLEGRFDGLEGRFDGLETRFDGMEIRMDRLEGEVHEVKSLFFSMRADVKEIRTVVKEHFKEPA